MNNLLVSNKVFKEKIAELIAKMGGSSNVISDMSDDMALSNEVFESCMSDVIDAFSSDTGSGESGSKKEITIPITLSDSKYGTSTNKYYWFFSVGATEVEILNYIIDGYDVIFYDTRNKFIYRPTYVDIKRVKHLSSSEKEAYNGFDPETVISWTVCSDFIEPMLPLSNDPKVKVHKLYYNGYYSYNDDKTIYSHSNTRGIVKSSVTGTIY